MSKKLAVSVGVVVLTLGVVTGYLADAPRSGVPEALAAVCKAPNQNCQMTAYKTSTLTVSHVYDPESTNVTVEPDSGESWSITAYWNTNSPPCAEMAEVATVDVDWNGSAWVLSNTTLTANITAIDLCSTDMWCTNLSEDHAYGYKLKVKLTDPVPGGPFHLRQVVYTTSAVDDGFLLNLGSCSLGSSVSPTTQSFSETDSGGFECGFDCDASGPSLVLEYE